MFSSNANLKHLFPPVQLYVRHCCAPTSSNWKVAWLWKGASSEEEAWLKLAALLNVWNYRVNLLNILTFLPSSFPVLSYLTPTHLKKNPTLHWGFTASAGAVKTMLRLSAFTLKAVMLYPNSHKNAKNGIVQSCRMRLRYLPQRRWVWVLLSHQKKPGAEAGIAELLLVSLQGWWLLPPTSISCLSGWSQAEPWWTSP